MKFSLILISFLALFLELTMIRWLPANVLTLAYFANIVLISSFLGLGLGFLMGSKHKDYFNYFPIILLGFIIIFVFFRKVEVIVPASENELLWNASGNELRHLFIQLGILPTLVLVFILNSLPFILIGQKTAIFMEKFKPLKAYGLNLLGSLLGIIVFTALSLLGWNLTIISWKLSLPLIWFMLAGMISLWFLKESRRYLLIGFVCILATAVILFTAPDTKVWSPYYGIEIGKAGHNSYELFVNRFFHQRILDFGSFPNAKEQYELPFTLKTAQKVLILGAGTGNDAAMALMQGVSEIDAVEIDPAIADLGRQLQPNRPYQNPKVHLFIDDARSFLRGSNKKYDMIILGTLDSHALLSAMSTVRLDNYVYTQESLQDIKQHLNSNGVVVLMFSVRRQWLGEKLVKSISNVFDNPSPLIYTGSYIGNDAFFFNLMMIGGPGVRDILKNHPIEKLPFKQVAASSFDPENISTDNWPYLYLSEHTIPSYYLEAIAALLVISFLGIFALSYKNIRSWASWNGLNFFCLGAAFLLLETKSVTTLSLLFGSTWLVNAFVFGGILTMLLLANVLVSKITIKRVELIYLFLGLSLLLNYFLPLSHFLGATFWIRSILPALIVALPIFFAAIIFSYNFKSVKDLSAMFGVNLMGAVFGGFLEYSSMIAGLNFLYILAGFIYLVNYLFQSNPHYKYRET